MKSAIFIICFLYLFVSADAQTRGSREYTLHECITTALQNNYDVQTYDSRLHSADADMMGAFGYFLPSISTNMGVSRMLNPKPGFGMVESRLVYVDPEPNSYNFSAGMSWNIFNGFSKSANYQRSQNNYNIALANSRFIRQRVILDIYKAYVDVIKKQQIVRIRQENLELGKKELERSRAQFDAGLVPSTSVLSQEADLGNKEYDLVIAERSLNISKAYLLNIMGQAPDVEAKFDPNSLPSYLRDIDVEMFRKSLGPYEEMLSKTLDSRLDFTAMRFNINAAKANLTVAKSSYYPTVSANAGWSWANNRFDEFDQGSSSIGLNFSFPIFDQFRTKTNVEKAKMTLKQSEIEMLQMENSIRSSLKTALLTLESAEKQLEISERAQKAAKMNFDSYKERFRVGSSSITEYLNANTQLITSQINRVSAIYDYMQAQKEVEYTIGKITY